jgi:hypothetical protein
MHLKYADWFHKQNLTWNYFIDHSRHSMKQNIAKKLGMSFFRVNWAVILKLHQGL